MDEYEDDFADEWEALQDIEPTSTKPRRSLNFATPRNKVLQNSIDDEIGSPVQPVTALLNSGQKKRQREKGSQSDSDLEYDDEDFKSSAPVTKRSKPDPVYEDDELWGDDPLQEKLLSPKIKPRSLYDNKGSKKGSTGSKFISSEPLEQDSDSPDKKLIELILEHRSKSGRELRLDTEGNRNESLIDSYDYDRVRVLRRIPGSAYLATTGTDGSRVYMTVKDDLQYEQQFTDLGKSVKESNLLSVPISALREQLEEERRSKLLEETQSLSENIHRQLNDRDQGFESSEDDDDKENFPNHQGPQSVLNTGPQRHLWVEKYTPRQYTDLLSEESINRSLLHWLKMWDYVVFGKELPVKLKEKKKEDFKKKKWGQPDIQEELDKHHRPLQKVALLCGPPGLGKTTLAHIIAKHAGYNVIEMNASDDRSAEVFKNKIESATQMKAVLGADPRPNCLVIDEIDGAPQAAINVLLNVIRKTDVQEVSKEGKKKKKEEGGILRRPMICICNDQYVPALRQLRMNALVINFPQTDPTKLAARLYEVISMERVRSDMNTLLALCEKTDNDIRSCLNTLQFIRGQCKELTMQNVQSLTVGQKDSHKNLFSVWHDILALPRPKRQKFVNLQESGMKDMVLNTTLPARFSNILSLVIGAGETDKLTQGLFENYLECKFKDPYMDGVSMATDWLCFSDEVNQYIQHKQDYRLMPYLSYLALTFHFLFASNSPPKIQYPHSMVDCNQRRLKSENLVSSMLVDMLPSVRKFLNLHTVTEDILPPLMDVIQPMFRPVNTQLYSAREKEELRQLVNVMISYNMTYIQEKTPDGQYNYALEPHVDEVTRFPNMKQHRQLSYASRQLVAREIELEKMRRAEQARAPKYDTVTVPVETPGQKDARGNPVSTGKVGGEKAPSVPSHLQRLTAKPLGKQEEMQVKDFFGRVVKRSSPETKSSISERKEKGNVLATDIWFHFQSGYSNAVRRTVRVKEFL
ncbi:chromosome transmission fidelity protein 18 homolog [Mya arenaria]|uniref:chromosome transmission fidelity protein 18 homolog n=1 Tax=Mya arenaria TaxID=6604 RepID=UPI0022DF48B4|nr:chromosome transmission fidelity protein 18 homolog [Mya arenaria]